MNQTCNVWQVPFLLADKTRFDMLDSSSIVVWVTTSEIVSKLSLDYWEAKAQQSLTL